MRLTLDPDQQQLRGLVRRLVEDRSGSAEVRTSMESTLGYDDALWKQMAEMGLLSLPVPPTLGGAGVGHVERCVVQEELGRGLVPSPFLATAVLATDVLLASGDSDACEAHLPRMGAGELLAAVAVAEGDDAWPSQGGTTTATLGGGDVWRLTGRKVRVINGDTAELLIVYAATPDGPAWFLVDASDAGIRCRVQTGLDHTRRLALLDLDDAPAARLRTDDPRKVLARIRDLAVVALAAEQVGGHERALDITVDYAKVRVQFGRAIGSYQAVKHGLVDVYCDLEFARSLVRDAVWTADHAPEELEVASAAAAAFVGPAYFEAAAAMIQYHGGIGFTWEHDAHLFYKRAKSTQLLLGTTSDHLARLAHRLGLPSPMATGTASDE